VSREALDASNLLLRGCTLRKTEWVIAAVVFTGEGRPSIHSKTHNYTEPVVSLLL